MMEVRVSSVYLLNIVLSILVYSCTADWGSPNSAQYHIQTDEGPERYFRYQTDNGQFRKEKRLQDGTVLGTEAWIDASGYLRQKDYIADNQGYRILKSKTVFVGQNRPIQEAIKAAKKSPPDAGTLVQHNVPKLLATTPATSTSPQVIIENPLGYDHYQQNKPIQKVTILPNSKPLVAAYLPANLSPSTTPTPTTIYVTPSSLHVDHLSPQHHHHHQIFKVPSNTIETPFSLSTADLGGGGSSTPQPIGIYSTPAPPIANYNTQHQSERPGFLQHTSERPYYQIDTAEQINNDLESLSNWNNPQEKTTNLYNHRTTSGGGGGVSVGNSVNGDSNSIGNGYDPQFPYYDGVSDTANGFRYYLPRQYHEENNQNPERRAGSFGYIDPFGIRRVVYYNTSPEGGFVHRKNNRYVGLNATPYDPRPV